MLLHAYDCSWSYLCQIALEDPVVNCLILYNYLYCFSYWNLIFVMPVNRVTILDHGSSSMKTQIKALAAAEGMIYFVNICQT